VSYVGVVLDCLLGKILGSSLFEFGSILSRKKYDLKSSVQQINIEIAMANITYTANVSNREILSLVEFITVGKGEGEVEGEKEGSVVGDREGSVVGDREGSVVGDREGLVEGDRVGLVEGVRDGLFEGDTEGLLDGNMEG